MKYIVDLDALKNCLSFLNTINFNDKQVVYLSDVKLFIDYFPKDAVENDATDVGDQ